MFEYRHQPLGTLFILYTIAWTLARIPYWILTSFSPSRRGRPTWSITRVLTIRILRTFIGVCFATSLPNSYEPEKGEKTKEKTGFVWVDPIPKEKGSVVVGEIGEMARVNGVEPVRVSGYWYGRRGVGGEVGQQAGAEEKVMIHFHGGGYVMSSGAPSDTTTPPICNGFLEHFSTINRVFALEYRIASAKPFGPANPFPAPVLDALAGYVYLIHTVGFRPENIIVSGDSAGGHITVALTRHLIHNKIEGIPPPSNILLLSPSLEWLFTHTGPQSSVERNKDVDYCALFYQGYVAQAIVGNLPENWIRTNPWIGPASLDIEDSTGWYTGFPRTCISAGDAEMQLDSIGTFRARLIRDIGEEKVTYIETVGGTHDFVGLNFHEPERTEALEMIASWIEGC
ncbi:alpha/beta-hydrolase [Lentinula aciculospora]|uniref:Alpha/beta-hydrolase n=1 Tax=Lentinula aciculospora TaxID=153920 RepID=A0A9W8ZZ69_9AGAR|nr:alpha/beta-hydrolase [Lentinula aciculospora]